MTLRSHLSVGARSARSALALAFVLLAGERSAVATNYTITVDASKQTAGNPPFWAASVGTGTASLTLRSDLESHYKIGNREAGFQRVRGHGVLSDAMGIYKGAGSYSWTNFDKYLTAITQAGMRPIMELDFMPTALALNGNDKDTYKNVTDWKNFIQAVVQHCVDWGTSHGVTDVSQWYWEVWNEPDYAGFWNGTNSSESASAKMTDYYALYDATVAAITAVIPNAIVGGPSTTINSAIPGFLQHCRSAGTRVSFVDSHVYPGGMSGGKTADAAGLVNDNNSRVSDITSNGYSTSSVMSFSTEWNSSYSGQGGNVGDNTTSMDNNWNVGLILKGMKMLSDKNSGNTPPITVSSYWVISDVFDESSGTAGSYILSHSNGNLPFGEVFGLMTGQGVRKAAFNAYKMLNQLGPVRLSSAGGTYNDGVDAMATLSSAGDSLQILAYDYYATLNTTGSDSVTVQVSNLPSGLSGKQVFVTQFVVDASHSNPYSVWTSQGSPQSPSESQWQAMKAAQHLALMQPVSTTTLSSSYSTTFTINRQGATLLILSTKRPVTGRNGLATIEAEDWDGQSSATKEDSNDTDLGQSIVGQSGSSVFYDVVDFSDAGVGSVQMRVNAASATNLEFHADSATGTLLGKCAVSATSGWATQSCTLSSLSGVHTLYVVFDGTVHLNWLLFQQGGSSTGTGGSGGGTGGATGSGGSGSGSGGSTSSGSGGSPGSGGAASGGSSGNGGSSGSGGSLVSGSGGSSSGSGGSGSGGSSSGSGGDGSGSGGNSGSGGSGSGGDGTASGGNSGSGGSSPASGGGGCACRVEEARAPSGTMLLTVLAAMAIGHRRRRLRRSR